MSELYDTIIKLREGLVSRKVEPLLISLVSVSRETSKSNDDILNELHSLEREGSIVMRRGLNDTLIELTSDRTHNRRRR